jgi:hypothetical protein
MITRVQVLLAFIRDQAIRDRELADVQKLTASVEECINRRLSGFQECLTELKNPLAIDIPTCVRSDKHACICVWSFEGVTDVLPKACRGRESVWITGPGTEH